jgi:hypothetical protein
MTAIGERQHGYSWQTIQTFCSPLASVGHMAWKTQPAASFVLLPNRLFMFFESG